MNAKGAYSYKIKFIYGLSKKRAKGDDEHDESNGNVYIFGNIVGAKAKSKTPKDLAFEHIN